MRGKIRKSLKYSLLDGIFASIMGGFTTEYITPYALALKAKFFEIGFLNAFSNLASAFSQLFSPFLTEKLKYRKKIINFFILLHTLMGLPIIFTPYIFKNNQVVMLIIFITLFSLFNALAIPAWSSLISEYIPLKKRGKYFGWRNKILGTVNILSTFLAGFLLYLFRKTPLKGFLIIFSIAFISRFLSWYFLTKMYEPPLKIKNEDKFNFFAFIKRTKESNFVKFALFVASLNFCVNLASPYFSVFMLKELKFNYLIYTFLTTLVPFTNILTIDRWGKISDKVGNLKILKTNSFFIASLPFWWILNQNPIYLIFPQILSGLAWAGFNLSANNFIYDAASPQKRIRCIAYFNMLNGLGSCLGALLGGLILNKLPPLFGQKILMLFFISSFLRMLVSFIFYKKLKEVRTTEKIKTKDIFLFVLGIKNC